LKGSSLLAMEICWNKLLRLREIKETVKGYNHTAHKPLERPQRRIEIFTPLRVLDSGTKIINRESVPGAGMSIQADICDEIKLEFG